MREPSFTLWRQFSVGLTAAAFALAVSTGAWAGNSWDDASNGKHSLQTLGEDFYVPLPMKKVEDGRLVLFNYEAAKRLGLKIPSDPKALEKMVLERFAYMVEKGDQPDKTWMATRYLDSWVKKPGEALGDGRAAWAGELHVARPDGSSAAVDVVLKGVGQTPLAWTNHDDPGHKDGFQSMEEAIHSFVTSEANYQNQLDSTVDLAVIEIPTSKIDKHTGRRAKAAITVRVGNQTRTAHFKYFDDEPRNFKKIYEYALKRDLDLPENTVVTERHVQKYLEKFTDNLAEEASRYYDLHAVHAAPTLGNRTTQGATIDLGTWRYLDAHHGEYDYLFHQLLLKDQTDQLKQYIDHVADFMKTAKYEFKPDARFRKALNERFEAQFRESVTDHWLKRLGLSEKEIAQVKPATRRKVYDAMWDLWEAQGTKAMKLGEREFKPAAFDVRKITGGSMEALSLADPKDAEKAFVELFKSDRSWAKGLPKDTTVIRKRYMAMLAALQKEIAPQGVRPEWIASARQIAANERFEVGKASVEALEHPIARLIEGGKTEFPELTAKAYEGVERYIDRGLIPRGNTNLGVSPEKASIRNYVLNLVRKHIAGL